MSTKINTVALLPRNVQGAATEVTDLDAIKKLLTERAIVSSSRFILPVGKYKFKGVTAAEWTNGKGRDAKQAVMCVLEFDNGKITTIGNLRKIDSKMKAYGPENLPLNEADLLEQIMEKGIEVTAVEDTTFTSFVNGERTVDENDPSGYKTKPGKIMAWKFAK